MYDFVIIGGGIIGMSTAMQRLMSIRMPALRCWKKSPARPSPDGPQQRRDPCRGLLHARYLKAQFCLAGNRATKAFCDQTAFALTTAARCWSPRLRSKWTDARLMGTHSGERYRARMANADELREREPNITGLGGIFVRPAALSATAK